jgi:hypothetical protein
MWTLIFPHHEGRSPTHGYEPTGEEARDANDAPGMLGSVSSESYISSYTDRD